MQMPQVGLQQRAKQHQVKSARGVPRRLRMRVRARVAVMPPCMCTCGDAAAGRSGVLGVCVHTDRPVMTTALLVSVEV